jgi:hypothetical protein
MVPALPGARLEVVEADLSLAFLEGLLDPVPKLGAAHEFGDRPTSGPWGRQYQRSLPSSVSMASNRCGSCPYPAAAILVVASGVAFALAWRWLPGWSAKEASNLGQARSTEG